MPIKLLNLNERQKLFFKAQRRFVAYGGARGGGKTWAVRVKAMLLASRYAGINILIIRRTYPELLQFLSTLPVRGATPDQADNMAG